MVKANPPIIKDKTMMTHNTTTNATPHCWCERDVKPLCQFVVIGLGAVPGCPVAGEL
jgi:hypothetical protein